MMKKWIFSLFILVSINSYSQADTAAIQKAVTQYFATLQNKDNNKMLDLLYPKIFKLAPRKQLLKIMDELYAEREFKIGFKDLKVKTISKTTTFNNVKYALISYNYEMLFDVTQTPTDSSAKDDSTIVDNTAIYLSSFKAQYGNELVQQDPITKTIIINLDKKMYAINDPLYKGWKFLEKKEGDEATLKKMIPAKIITSLK
jgi:hypothetical protein